MNSATAGRARVIASAMDGSSVSKWFVLSSGFVLALTGIAKAWSSFGSTKVLAVGDPIIGLPFRWLLLTVGVLELIIAGVCFFNKNKRLAVLLVAWLATNFLTYRVGLWWMGWHRPCGCLGSLTDALHISPQTADNIMKVVLAYLLIGSYGILIRSWVFGHERARKGMSKTHCFSVRRTFAVCLVAAFLVACSEGMYAADGYRAMGYLTYTRFDADNPTYKRMLMFEVKVDGAEWQIRTEPVIEKTGGIAYYEASRTTNDSIILLTGFASAYKSAESPFQALRPTLKNLIENDSLSANKSPSPLPALSNALTSEKSPETAAIVSNLLSSLGKTVGTNRVASNHINNVAEAVAVKGTYPPSDPSYVALVWFALTPPNIGPDKMLLQIWDDGNRRSTRFRRAKWTQFKEDPQLVSSAVYDWVGKQLLKDGSLETIDTSDVTKPEEMAANYEVETSTNFNGLTLPASFKLTRFTPWRRNNGEQVTSSTVVGKVVEVGTFSADGSLEVKLPGKTAVIDYRLSADELKGSSVQYITSSNSLPEEGWIRRTGQFKRSSIAVETTTTRSSLVRWSLFALIAIFPLVWILWKKRP